MEVKKTIQERCLNVLEGVGGFAISRADCYLALKGIS